MAEFKLPKINNGFNITKEEYDEFIKFQRIAKFQLQEINDNLSGGLTSRNLASFRNTYVINAQDSLDATYPMYVHFNIISEMIKIVSVKVSFWILNYRAYSKAGASGGGSTPTSSDGGGQTSSSVTTPSGGAATSGVVGNSESAALCHYHWIVVTQGTGYALKIDASGNIVTAEANPPDASTVDGQNVSLDHRHTTPNHTHPEHSHTVVNHNHTVTIANHTHDAVYGIFEEDTSPTIKFYVSENEGVSYNDTFFGGYDTNKKDLEITSLLTSVGSKLIKFTSDVRARLSVQIEIKVDIKARN